MGLPLNLRSLLDTPDEKKLPVIERPQSSMGCGDSKGADASVELDDDVDPLVIEEALKQAAEAVQAAASAAEAAQAGAQRAAEAARAAAAATALVAEAVGPAAAAAATKAFQAAAQDGRQQDGMPPMITPPRAGSPSPRDELSPRVRRPSIPKQESFGHRTHDQEVVEFEDEPDTPDDSETEASDVESLDRVPVTPSTPSTPPPARNGGFKPRGPSPLALSAAAVPPVPIRDQVQRALLTRARAHARRHTHTRACTRTRTHTHARAHKRASQVTGGPSRSCAAAPLHALRPCTAAPLHALPLRPRCAGPVGSAGRDLGGRAPIHCRAGGGHGGAAVEDAAGGAAHSSPSPLTPHPSPLTPHPNPLPLPTDDSP